MDPKELTEQGITLTPLEQRLLENSHFQWFWETGGLKLAERTLHSTLVEGGGLEPLPDESSSPNAIGKLYDDHLRPLMILLATIRRDTDLSDPRDRELISDLQSWLQGSKPSFRWDRLLADQERKRKEEERKLSIFDQQMGDAELIIFLLTRLTQAEREELEKSLEMYCISKGLFPTEAYRNDSQRKRYFPRPRCLFCSTPVGTVSYRFSGHGWGDRGRSCNSENALALIDGGPMKDVASTVPAKILKLVRKVRFRIPRRILLLHRFTNDNLVIPQMLIFGLDQLTAEEQPEVHQRLLGCLEEAHNEERSREYFRRSKGEEESTLYRSSGLFVPVNSRRTDALVVAGHAVDEPRDGYLFNWSESLTEGDFGPRFFDSGRITISIVKAN